MTATGKKPGKGTYQCKKCRYLVRVIDKSHALPKCPNCSNTEFNRI